MINYDGLSKSIDSEQYGTKKHNLLRLNDNIAWKDFNYDIPRDYLILDSQEMYPDPKPEDILGVMERNYFLSSK